jgi:uncharacterized DUF497 family protein/predicted DNA binding CopG/RHH family protein
MQFEWDENKNALNKTKHGVSFEDAQSVFNDPLHISKLDYRFSYFEERWITIGTTSNLELLVVACCFFPMMVKRSFESFQHVMQIQMKGQFMKSIEERAQFDDYEMTDNYDFNDGIRGRFYQSKKVRATMQLDNDVVLFLKKQASEQHVKYHVLVNNLLRTYMNSSLKS